MTIQPLFKNRNCTWKSKELRQLRVYESVLHLWLEVISGHHYSKCSFGVRKLKFAFLDKIKSELFLRAKYYFFSIVQFPKLHLNSKCASIQCTSIPLMIVEAKISMKIHSMAMKICYYSQCSGLQTNFEELSYYIYIFKYILNIN